MQSITVFTYSPAAADRQLIAEDYSLHGIRGEAADEERRRQRSRWRRRWCLRQSRQKDGKFSRCSIGEASRY